MVAVFKTNVLHEDEAHLLRQVIGSQAGITRCDFDLEDCDKILRIECRESIADKVIGLLARNGFMCEEL